MSLKEKLEKDYITAAKAKEAQKVSTLRMVRAAIKNAEIDKMKQFEDPEVESVIRTEVKKLKESLQIATDAGRPEMVAQAETELSILTGYLPEQMDEAGVRAIVAEKISTLGEVTEKDMGRVTGEVMKVLKGRADGALVQRIIKELLALK